MIRKLWTLLVSIVAPSNFLSDRDRYEMALTDIVYPEIACREEWLAGKIGIIEFDCGPLPEGEGVVVTSDGDYIVPASPQLVYWVLEGVVFSVNEAAQHCSPHLQKAPEHVTVEDILAVAK